MSGEIWLGLESLYQLTSEGNYSLHINLTDFDQKTYVAVYDQFQVVKMIMIMWHSQILGSFEAENITCVFLHENSFIGENHQKFIP